MGVMKDGYSTIIEFGSAALAGIRFRETRIKPPDLDGGGPIQTTSMRNSVWRTAWPKQLVTFGECTIEVMWDSTDEPDWKRAIQDNAENTITFPDGAQIKWWGWLDKKAPGDHTEGNLPTATLTLIASMENNEGTEVSPTYIAGGQDNELVG